MENCDYVHVVWRVIAQPHSLGAVPSGMRSRTEGGAEWGARLGTYTIIDRLISSIDFYIPVFS